MSNIFDGKKAALIDMDGVLYDSMPGHTLAWKRMMDDLGVECTRDEFYLYEGMTGTATIDLLFRRAFGHGCEPGRAKELYEVKSRYFRECGRREPMPGADRMLGSLGAAGLTRVLVTGSGQESLLEALDRDYPGTFGAAHRVTAHDVAHGKPDPEPYLKGADKAGVTPSECIVVENAPLGVRAGKAAGCFTIAVTTGPIAREAFEREGADMIFPSMPAFAEFLELELVKKRCTRVTDDTDIIYTDTLETTVHEMVDSLDADRVFLLTDKNVARLGLLDVPDGWRVNVIDPGEESKSLETTESLWRWLAESGATRRSLLINLGGGVVTDLGGFVAATFKRGIRFLNVPTTLLGAADAAIGSKTGIDFMGYKNEVGAFAPAEKVIICPVLLKSLPERELKSGFAEVVKMAIVTDCRLYRELLDGDALRDHELLERAVLHAARAKEEVVRIDPHERGLRRILNFGHTAGHAYESYAARTGCPITHGEAVAHGMLRALELSRDREGFPADEVEKYRRRILERYYAPLPFGAEADGEIVRLMAHDKKNLIAGDIRYVLLRRPGHPV